MAIRQDIEILIRANAVGIKDVAEMHNNLARLNAQAKNLYKGFEQTKRATNVFSNEIRFGKDNLKKSSEELGDYIELNQLAKKPIYDFATSERDRKKGLADLNKKVKENAKEMNKGMKEAKRFKAEWLGVMFAGMAMQQFFGNLTKGAMEWLGASELLSTSIDYLMFQSLLPYSDTLYGTAEAIFNIADSTDAASVALKDFLGATALIGQGAGMFLQIFGQLFLALTSITLAFDGLEGITAPALGAIASSFGILLGNIKSDSPFLNMIGTTMATLGTTLMALPAAQAAGDVEIFGNKLGKAATYATLLAAGGAGFFASNGIGNVMALLGDKVSSVNSYMTVTANKLETLAGKEGGYQIQLELKGNVNSQLAEIEAKLARIGVNLPNYTPISGGFGYAPPPKGITPSIFSKTGPYTPAPIRPPLMSPRIYQYGGVVPGRFGEPVPIIAHGGERFEGIHGSGNNDQSIVINAVYNISVSDKREMESIMKANNAKLVEEVRRLSFGG